MARIRTVVRGIVGGVRSVGEGAPREPFQPVGQKTALFAFDEPGAWTRYRCDHQAERLTLRGLSADIVHSSRIDLASVVDHYERFVLNRVRWTDDVGTFLARARSSGKSVVFDTDDLLFEPGLIDHLAAFDGWPEAERRDELEKLDGYRRTLEKCDGVTVSTDPLAGYARQRNTSVEVVYNVVGVAMIQLADEALSSQTGQTGDTVTLAYLSGTRTHNRDFLEVADAVLWALAEYPNTRFIAVGKLFLDERFDQFGARVSRIGLQPWQELPKILSAIDINLAPLERDNPFTECKSCVKYLEAALLGVPTVASPRPDFERVIRDGRNGLLADNRDQWRLALQELIESRTRRQEVGALAREDVRANHTTRITS